MRILFPASLFLAAALGVSSTEVSGQPNTKPDAKTEPKSKYAPPAAIKPDEATLQQIAEKTKALREAVRGLEARRVPPHVHGDVAIFLKAAEYIVKFDEWYHKDSGKWTLTVLDRGLERAKQAETGQTPWRQPGKWVNRAYVSAIDGSLQPYAVLLPADYGKDPAKKWRLDVVLHGRDSSLTEAKFLATHDSVREAPKDLGYVQLEVYGRGNNAYRWAGERDVFEAFENFMFGEQALNRRPMIDTARIVLRGFSMGGAGSWHIGLQHPFRFAVVGPGAGFTTTHGYIPGLPNPLPDYQEKCLTIYDAVNYAENVFDVPVVAYSGEKDAQKLAADNIEKLVNAYPEKLPFTHLVAPGLEHKMPAEWQAKAEAEYQKYVGPGRTFPEKVHYVTYTLRYPAFGWGEIHGLDQHYAKTVIDGSWTKDGLTLKTQNARVLFLYEPPPQYPQFPASLSIDGQSVAIARPQPGQPLVLQKTDGKWSIPTAAALQELMTKTSKQPGLQGPIDDAFTGTFTVVNPTGSGYNAAVDAHVSASLNRFTHEWQKWLRGPLPTAKPGQRDVIGNRVLFGDPQSNPMIAALLPRLPFLKWDADTIEIAGEKYDAKTHVPVLIAPDPNAPGRYVVINSGHTFHEAEFKATNAQLYPRFGDWAVLKLAPTAKDPAATEIVAAGLFDEFWQIPTK
jgi:hypothetical protein